MSDYNVGISLTLLDYVSGGLTAIGARMGVLNTQATSLNSTLIMIGKGAALAAVGFKGLSMLEEPLNAAKEYQTQLAQFKSLGLGDHVNHEADKVARGMNIIGASSLESMKMLKEATAITGDFEHAKEVTPFLLKMRYGVESVMGGGHGGKFDDQIQSILKTAELRNSLIDKQTGHMDMSKFQGMLDKMTQAYVASGGLVKPSDFLQAIKTGGVAAKTMSDDAFFGLGHFIQESGGSRTGTSTMSMFQNWAMGRMSQKSAERMMDLGLLEKEAVQISSKSGHITGVDIGGLKNLEMFRENPFKYVNEIIKPALEKKGYKGEDLNMQLAGILQNRTASNLADTMIREQKVAELYNERAKKAMGVEGLYQTGAETLQGQQIDYEAQKNKLLTELGTAVLPMAVAGLSALISAVKGLTSFAQEFPNLTKGLVIGFAGLMAAMAIGGTVMVLAGGFRLLGIALNFGGVLTGATSALRALVPLATGALSGLGTAIMWVGRALLANPVGLILTGIALAGILIYRNWSTIRPMIMQAMAAVTAGWRRIVYSVSSAMLTIATVTSAGWQRVVYTASLAIEWVVNKWVSGGNMIKSAVQSVISFIVSAFQGLAGAVSGALSGISNMASGIGGMARSAMSAIGIGKADAATKINPIAPPATKPTVVNTQINMDGRKVAQAVTVHQSKSANSPQRGTTRHDGNMSPRYVGAH